MGSHRFAYALYPHAGRWQEGGVVAEALAFNAPLVWAPASFESLFAADTSDLVLDTVKLAEREDALVVRLYEAHGARGRARIAFGVDVGSVVRANLLEDPAGDDLLRGGREPRARLPPLRDHHAAPATLIAVERLARPLPSADRRIA